MSREKKEIYQIRAAQVTPVLRTKAPLKKCSQEVLLTDALSQQGYGQNSALVLTYVYGNISFEI